MRQFFLIALPIAILAQAPAGTPIAHNLMPVPATVRWLSGQVRIGPATFFVLGGVDDARMDAAARRMIKRFEGRTGFTLSRDGDLRHVDIFVNGPGPATMVNIEAQSAGKAIPALDEDESYSIEATAAPVGRIVLRAPTVVGAMRGMETLLQLLSGDRQGFYIPAVSIQDAPRFRWRGLLIDSGRHFEPVDVMKRELDAMAAVKLNVLHWHLSEDQGFRVESRKFPKLQELGSDGQYYTQDQIRDVVEYARMRGIRVVPEFDMPGHVTSWVTAYPELASAPGPYEIARGFGVFDPAFDPTKESTYKFIDTFIGEIAPLFPDAYWHIGGDENNGKQWKANPAIQAFMEKHKLADAHALQTYFNQRLLKILVKHKKQMMGWDEIFEPGLPKETVVHSWRGQKGLVDAAKAGYDAVLSAGYYIDLLETTATHYSVDPLPATSELSPEEARHILGGEATMWGEWVSPETIDSRVWPRTAAIAERFWSPRDVKDVDDMYRRLGAISIQLEELGLTHEKNVDMLLRRLAGARDVAPLRTLVDVVEPVKGYTRGSQQKGTTFLPLTHLVDAASTDAIGARQVTREIDALLNDAPRFMITRAALKARFTAWRDAKPGMDALIERAPGLAETAPLAKDLADLGSTGLEVLTLLEMNVTPDAAWRDRTVALLDQIARPKAALSFPFVPSMKELVFAVVERPALESTPLAEWRARLKTLANPPRRGRGGG